MQLGPLLVRPAGLLVICHVLDYRAEEEEDEAEFICFCATRGKGLEGFHGDGVDGQNGEAA